LDQSKKIDKSRREIDERSAPLRERAAASGCAAQAGTERNARRRAAVLCHTPTRATAAAAVSVAVAAAAAAAAAAAVAAAVAIAAARPNILIV